MSVILKNQNEIDNLAENICDNLYPSLRAIIERTEFYKKRNKYSAESIETFISRALWYGYIANKTAYELQYQENIDINFNSASSSMIKEMNEQDISDKLGSLLYNIYTNDGNCFLQDDWVNVIDMLSVFFREKAKNVNLIN